MVCSLKAHGQAGMVVKNPEAERGALSRFCRSISVSFPEGQKEIFPEPTPVRLCFRFAYHSRFTREPIPIHPVRFLRVQVTVI